MMQEHGHEIILRGASICPGTGIGRARIVDPDISVSSSAVGTQQIGPEKERYTAAVDAAKHNLRKHVETMHGTKIPDAEAVLDAHEVMLSDESFHEQVLKRIDEEHRQAEWCLWQEASDLVSRFDAMRDPYFKARGEDVRDMARNLIEALQEDSDNSDRLTQNNGEIFVSRHLLSSDVVLAHHSKSVGFVSESRALVSHAAILLKGFAVPSVAGIDGLADHVHEGDILIVDGSDGLVIVRPASKTLEKYREASKKDALSVSSSDIVGCVGADGTRVTLKANIENPGQVELMLRHGLDGIGLFRTEFLGTPNGGVPTEEEQYAVYGAVAEKADGRLVIIRTFDIGGDKSMGLLSRCTGMNPALGIRGIRRHLLDHPEEFRSQVRAILRASIGGDVGILIPMVTTIDDVVAAKKHISAVREDLNKAGVALSEEVRFGVMLEIPAAAAIVGDILAEVDFVSVGTNDLLQYFMAADRDNESLIHYQDAANPAFLWLMEHIIQRAHQMRRVADVTVCGEIAADERVLPHLLRMGYRSFSISPVSTPLFRTVCGNFFAEMPEGASAQ